MKREKLKKFYTHIVEFSLLAITGLCVSTHIFAAPAKGKNKNQKKTIPTNCLVCLNDFSPETLTFTTRADKCPAILARCNKSTSTARCEGIIYDCFAANCEAEGSCIDEISNRNLAYGCLKASGAYLPYTCASYIAGLAKSYADQVEASLNAKDQAHEIALKQQEAKIASDKAAAERAAADAQVKAAQAEADAKAKQAQIEAQNKLEQQKLQAQLEEQAKQAELARQKQAQIDARNNKPNVKYNNILSAVKKDISSAKTHTSKLFNLLGIEKVSNSSNTNSGLTTIPTVTVYGLSTGIMDAKTKSYINASKYKETTDFRCTRDTKESYVKSELTNALNILTQSRSTLANSISELEALNADDEVTGAISQDKINTLYEVQNKLTETINEIETEIGGLKTSCQTRCAGVSAISFTSGGPKFDENGLIVENSGDDYSCDDFKNTTGNNNILSLMSGNSSTSSLFGGQNQQINDLTQRVTKAVLTADRALEGTEIAAATGNYASTSTNYAVINSCLKYTLDTTEYIKCIKSTLGEQLQILAQYPDSNVSRNDNTYTAVLEEFKKSAKVALELLNSDTYKNKAKCSDGTSSLCCDKNTTTITEISIAVHDSATARQCATNLAARLVKAEKGKNKDDDKNSNYIFISANFITVTTDKGTQTVTPAEFIKDYCKKYSHLQHEAKIVTQMESTTVTGAGNQPNPYYPAYAAPVNVQTPSYYIQLGPDSHPAAIITNSSYASMCKESEEDRP